MPEYTVSINFTDATAQITAGIQTIDSGISKMVDGAKKASEKIQGLINIGKQLTSANTAMAKGFTVSKAAVTHFKSALTNAQTASSSVGNALKTLGISTQDLSSALATIVGNDTVEKFNTLREKISESVQTVNTFIDTTKSLFDTFSSWKTQIQEIAAEHPRLFASFKKIGMVIASYVKLAAVSTWTGIKMAAAWVVGLGPIAWIIAGFTAVGAAVWYFWDDIQAAFSKIWTFIKPFAALIFKVLAFPFLLIWKGILVPLAEWFGNKLAPVFQWVGNIASTAWEGIKTGLSFLWDLTIGYYTWLGSIFLPIWESISDAASIAWDYILSAFNAVIDGIKSGISWILDAIQPITDFLGGWADTLMNGISSAIGGFIELGSQAAKVWDAVFGPDPEASTANVSDEELAGIEDRKQREAALEEKMNAASGNEKLQLEKELALMRFENNIAARNQAARTGSISQADANKMNDEARARIDQIKKSPAVPIMANNGGGSTSTTSNANNFTDTSNTNVVIKVDGGNPHDVEQAVKNALEKNKQNESRRMRGSMHDY